MIHGPSNAKFINFYPTFPTDTGNISHRSAHNAGSSADIATFTDILYLWA